MQAPLKRGLRKMRAQERSDEQYFVGERRNLCRLKFQLKIET